MSLYRALLLSTDLGKGVGGRGCEGGGKGVGGRGCEGGGCEGGGVNPFTGVRFIMMM